MLRLEIVKRGTVYEVTAWSVDLTSAKKEQLLSGVFHPVTVASLFDIMQRLIRG